MNNILQMVFQIKQNPMQFILQRGFNLPINIGSDPNAIIQHLMNTGQVSQGQYDSAVHTLNQFMSAHK